jgi:hypothetical protein
LEGGVWTGRLPYALLPLWGFPLFAIAIASFFPYFIFIFYPYVLYQIRRFDGFWPCLLELSSLSDFLSFSVAVTGMLVPDNVREILPCNGFEHGTRILGSEGKIGGEEG